jgi:hypothetical protein
MRLHQIGANVDSYDNSAKTFGEETAVRRKIVDFRPTKKPAHACGVSRFEIARFNSIETIGV